MDTDGPLRLRYAPSVLGSNRARSHEEFAKIAFVDTTLHPLALYIPRCAYAESAVTHSCPIVVPSFEALRRILSFFRSGVRRSVNTCAIAVVPVPSSAGAQLAGHFFLLNERHPIPPPEGEEDDADGALAEIRRRMRGDDPPLSQVGASQGDGARGGRRPGAPRPPGGFQSRVSSCAWADFMCSSPPLALKAALRCDSRASVDVTCSDLVDLAGDRRFLCTAVGAYVSVTDVLIQNMPADAAQRFVRCEALDAATQRVANASLSRAHELTLARAYELYYASEVLARRVPLAFSEIFCVRTCEITREAPGGDAVVETGQNVLFPAPAFLDSTRVLHDADVATNTFTAMRFVGTVPPSGSSQTIDRPLAKAFPLLSPDAVRVVGSSSCGDTLPLPQVGCGTAVALAESMRDRLGSAPSSRARIDALGELHTELHVSASLGVRGSMAVFHSTDEWVMLPRPTQCDTALASVGDVVDLYTAEANLASHHVADLYRVLGGFHQRNTATLLGGTFTTSCRDDLVAAHAGGMWTGVGVQLTTLLTDTLSSRHALGLIAHVLLAQTATSVYGIGKHRPMFGVFGGFAQGKTFLATTVASLSMPGTTASLSHGSRRQTTVESAEGVLQVDDDSVGKLGNHGAAQRQLESEGCVRTAVAPPDSDGVASMRALVTSQEVRRARGGSGERIKLDRYPVEPGTTIVMSNLNSKTFGDGPTMSRMLIFFARSSTEDISDAMTRLNAAKSKVEWAMCMRNCQGLVRVAQGAFIALGFAREAGIVPPMHVAIASRVVAQLSFLNDKFLLSNVHRVRSDAGAVQCAVAVAHRRALGAALALGAIPLATPDPNVVARALAPLTATVGTADALSALSLSGALYEPLEEAFIRALFRVFSEAIEKPEPPPAEIFARMQRANNVFTGAHDDDVPAPRVRANNSPRARRPVEDVYKEYFCAGHTRKGYVQVSNNVLEGDPLVARQNRGSVPVPVADARNSDAHSASGTVAPETPPGPARVVAMTIFVRDLQSRCPELRVYPREQVFALLAEAMKDDVTCIGYPHAGNGQRAPLVVIAGGNVFVGPQVMVSAYASRHLLMRIVSGDAEPVLVPSLEYTPGRVAPVLVAASYSLPPEGAYKRLLNLNKIAAEAINAGHAPYERFPPHVASLPLRGKTEAALTRAEERALTDKNVLVALNAFFPDATLEQSYASTANQERLFKTAGRAMRLARTQPYSRVFALALCAHYEEMAKTVDGMLYALEDAEVSARAQYLCGAPPLPPDGSPRTSEWMLKTFAAYVFSNVRRRIVKLGEQARNNRHLIPRNDEEKERERERVNEGASERAIKRDAAELWQMIPDDGAPLAHSLHGLRSEGIALEVDRAMARARAFAHAEEEEEEEEEGGEDAEEESDSARRAPGADDAVGDARPEESVGVGARRVREEEEEEEGENDEGSQPPSAKRARTRE